MGTTRQESVADPADTVVRVPEGAPTDDGVRPCKDVIAVFTSPGGIELEVCVRLSQVGHSIGVGVYPTADRGVVLRWDDDPREDPAVIFWQAPHCKDDQCGSPCGHEEG